MYTIRQFNYGLQIIACKSEMTKTSRRKIGKTFYGFLYQFNLKSPDIGFSIGIVRRDQINGGIKIMKTRLQDAKAPLQPRKYLMWAS